MHLHHLSQLPRPPTPPPFPYTTLFRSNDDLRAVADLDKSIALKPTEWAYNQRAWHAYKRDDFDAALRDVTESRSEEHTSELQSLTNLVCRLLLEKKNNKNYTEHNIVYT